MSKKIDHEEAIVSRCPECGRILVTDLSITRGHGATCYIGKLERRVEDLESQLQTCFTILKSYRGH